MTKKTDNMQDIRNWAANNIIDYWEDILYPKTKADEIAVSEYIKKEMDKKVKND